MTKALLIDKVSERIQGLTRKQTEIVVETFFESIRDALVRGEKIELRGFGNFKLKTRKPRKARNPRTGESVDVPAKKVLHFKPGKELREMLNTGGGHDIDDEDEGDDE